MKRFRISYYQKLVFSHLIVLVLAISIMSIFSYLSSRNQQNERLLNIMSYSGEQTVSALESRLLQMNNVSEMVALLLQQTLRDSTSKTPQPQVVFSTISTLRTLRDTFDFVDISAWIPSSFFSPMRE